MGELEYNRFRKLPFGINPRNVPDGEDIPVNSEDLDPDAYLGENDPKDEPKPKPEQKPPGSAKPPKPEPEDKVDVPTKVTILEQVIRWTPTGEQVVDVLLAFETGDDPGVAFEHKVTKA